MAEGSQTAQDLRSAAETSSRSPAVNIGTRSSVLARIQTDIVVQALKKAWPDKQYAIHAITPIGDKDKVTPLHELGIQNEAQGGKSLWTFELEKELEEGRIDMIVHSLKDVPTHLPPSLTLGAILPRHDPRDALVLHPSLPPHTTLSSLPAGAVIGTSSVRRVAQLSRAHPHLQFRSVRGNVGTRLAKLDTPQSEFSAIILAAAGLERLGMGGRIAERGKLSWREGGSMHAVGQGALGVEIREGDGETERMVRGLGCERTTRECVAERSLMRTLEGGCSVPIGVETEWGAASGGGGTAVGRPSLDGSGGGGGGGGEGEAQGASPMAGIRSHNLGVSAGAKPARTYDQLSGQAVPESASTSASAQTSMGVLTKQDQQKQEVEARSREADEETNEDGEDAQVKEPRRSSVDDVLTMRAVVTSLDGKRAVQAELSRRITSRDDAELFGLEVAKVLVDKGAGDILKDILLNRKIIEQEQGGA